MTGRRDAIEIFNSAVTAVQPASLLASELAVTMDALYISGQSLPWTTFDKIYVIGAGKAAAAMAVATEKILGTFITDGLVVTKYGHALPSATVKIIEGAHPVPDENCVKGVAETLRLLQKVTSNDIVICLLSGGASSLWCDVPPGTALQDLQTAFYQMVNSGVAIDEMNDVRKHLSCIKGGQLINYCNGARVFSLIISDVPGDDLSAIASGPTVGDESTFSDAYAILLKYHLLPVLPQSIRNYIEKGLKGMIVENPRPGNAVFSHTVNRIIGNNQVALEAAGKKARVLGYHTEINPGMITGNTASEARKLVLMVSDYSGKKRVCILQGGETTIKVTGKGKGGRNQHFVLTALNELIKRYKKNIPGKITILSGGTDGTDGPTDAAGAIIDDETIEQVLRTNLPVKEYLENNDAYHFFEKTNGLLITGPTQTNVMDIMIAIIDES